MVTTAVEIANLHLVLTVYYHCSKTLAVLTQVAFTITL
jgi:hypothetical protein